MADNDSYIIPTASDVPFPLGRAVHHDPRNRQFRALIEPINLPPVTRRWRRRTPSFNQQGSSCTAQASIGLLRTAPNLSRQGMLASGKVWPKFDDEAERHALYRRAQEIDPWPGSEDVDPRYKGSSGDAVLKVLRDEGVITGWRTLFGGDEVHQYVMHIGPVSVGTVWTHDMFHPDVNGFISPTGAEVGGHQYEILGYNLKFDAYEICNSWSPQWGLKGRCWMKQLDLHALLASNGDAQVIV